MITPSFSPTATERVLPRLALDFTTASLDPRVTFTRSGNTATYTNSSGVITAINADLPRFDYNPTTLICQGLLIEEARTNVLLNSLINGTSLATQSVTTTATAYTLSFYGTGSIGLSGTHTATVTGTGAYPSRKTYTFTPTAGTLTLTVTGTVQFAQLETGSFATSFIPTDSTSKTRNADVATMTGTNFSSWYNQTQGSFYTSSSSLFISASPVVYGRPLAVRDGTQNNSMELLYTPTGANFQGYASSAFQGAPGVAGTILANTIYEQVGAYATNNVNSGVNGVAGTTDTTFAIPAVNEMRIGAGRATTPIYHNGHIQKIMYWPQRLTDAELAAFSK